jgi:hypothetical protein
VAGSDWLEILQLIPVLTEQSNVVVGGVVVVVLHEFSVLISLVVASVFLSKSNRFSKRKRKIFLGGDFTFLYLYR